MPPLFSAECLTPDSFNCLLIIAAVVLLLGIVLGFVVALKAPWIHRKTVIAKASTVSGRGVFALVNFREGDIIERCPALEVRDRDVDGELLNYVFYGSTEQHRLVAMGNGMLFNHDNNPNVAYYREDTPLGAELVLYALRNIRKGEELFYSYGEAWWATRQNG
uniref:Nuclear protein SET n=1 Tax=Chlorobium chlorochromatii (strain CaD3) TaxID=340177 RepID=Q3AQH3_CHLCH